MEVDDRNDHHFLAHLYQNLGQVEQAIKILENALKQHTGNIYRLMALLSYYE